MLSIRPFRESDSFEALTLLLNRAYAELGEMRLNYTAVDQSAAVTAQRIENGQCFIAEWDGGLVGTALVKPTDVRSECAYFTRAGVASLRQFGVYPNFRRRGIGLQLIQSCEDWARAHGFRELALDTAKPAKHLVSLYTRLGYTPVGVVQWPGKVYESVVLSKVLDDA
jgi:GNAT superfamily N-acetyltransferase